MQPVQIPEPPHVLREYAFLADGERGALIGPRGDIAWMCAPAWDSDAVFAGILGGPGRYSVTPAGRFVWGGFYQPRSLIWHSRWVIGDAIVECREALALPADRHRAVLLRQLISLRGSAQLDVKLAPAAHFRAQGRLTRDDSGTWTGRVDELRLRWSGAGEAAPVDGAFGFRVDLAAGATRDFVLEISDAELPAAVPDPAQLWEQTETAWHRAVPELGRMAAKGDAEHAYAVLHGMTTAGGGLVAASTMSLPERADEGANYDYRYVWIRDTCIAGQAIAADGPHPLLQNMTGYVAERLLEDGSKLMPAYAPSGGAIPPPRTLDLPGYPGGGNTLGNHVRDQFQLDAFGETLLLLAAASRHGLLADEHRGAAAVAVSAIEDNYRRPDAGIWELDEKRYAHSRLVCAAGLRACAGLGLCSDDRLTALADTLVADVAADCTHSTGRWQRAPDDPRVDAGLLLPVLRGAVPPGDPHAVATYQAVRRELTRDYYVYRFVPEQGLESAESAFLLCGFAMAMVARQQGDHVEAARFFERNRTACGPPGILAEEYDITERQMRGNLPQAFVHAAVFEASVRLADSASDLEEGLST